MKQEEVATQGFATVLGVIVEYISYLHAALKNMGHTTSTDNTVGTFYGVTPLPHHLGAALENTGVGHTMSDVVHTFCGRVTPPPGFDLQARCHTTSPRGLAHPLCPTFMCNGAHKMLTPLTVQTLGM